MRLSFLPIFIFVAQAPSVSLAERAFIHPWEPEACEIPTRAYANLHPAAHAKLRELKLDHRINSALSLSNKPSNYHGVDGYIGGAAYTGAVDLNVTCLMNKPTALRELLILLAENGFAAWYRSDQQEGWVGGAHIHAIWVGCALKEQLQRQVEDWLKGLNGLAEKRDRSDRQYRGHQPYTFWKHSDELTTKIAATFRAYNPSK